MAIDRITTGAVLDGAIQTADIANLAVDDTKLKAGAVTAEKMAPGAAFVTGMVMPYAGAIVNQAGAPSGWLLCDGSEQDASVYVALKNLLQTTYGPYSNGSGGTGTTHFRLPDLRGRVIAALDNMGGGSADVINEITNHANADSLGGVLGDDVHELTIAELPSHGHGGVVTGGTGGARVQTTSSVNQPIPIYSLNSGSTSNQGGGDKHANMQPTMFMNYIIKT